MWEEKEATNRQHKICNTLADTLKSQMHGIAYLAVGSNKVEKKIRCLKKNFAD
jgi:stress-induced morphogen